MQRSTSTREAATLPPGYVVVRGAALAPPPGEEWRGQKPVTANQRSPIPVTPAKNTAGPRQGVGGSPGPSPRAPPLGETGPAPVPATATPPQATMARPVATGFVWVVARTSPSTSTCRRPPAVSVA